PPSLILTPCAPPVTAGSRPVSLAGYQLGCDGDLNFDVPARASVPSDRRVFGADGFPALRFPALRVFRRPEVPRCRGAGEAKVRRPAQEEAGTAISPRVARNAMSVRWCAPARFTEATRS